jgi:hydrogenase maturation protease
VQTILLDDPGLNLLGLIAGRDAAILVAALQVGAPLGTVRVFQDRELDEIPAASRKGGGWGAAQTLSLGRQLTAEDLPGRLILIGIEGGRFGLGEGLSPAVRSGIPQALAAVDQALKEIKKDQNSLRAIYKRVRLWLQKTFAGPARSH